MELAANESPLLTSRFESALVFAAQLHARQIRKGTHVPYISHLMSVAALVIEDGGDEDEAIAALLHDAIEDQGGATTREAIRQQFGERVVQTVEGCTESVVLPKPPWKERKLRYLQKMRSASPEVCRISLADKLHNARTIVMDLRHSSDSFWQRFNGGREGTLWYYRSLLAIYQDKAAGVMVQELEKVVQEMEKLAFVSATSQSSTKESMF